jgi:large subunit ribosomal protein L11
MAKKIVGYINLIIPSGMANPSPPIGPALGQKGLNIMNFCKDFNAQTEKFEKGMPIPVVITCFEDRTYNFIMKKPPATYFVKKAIKLESGSKLPGRESVGTISQAALRKIAEEKMVDLNANTIEAAMKIIAGSARSMGVDVVEG